MTDGELEQLLDDIESDRAERKASDSVKKKFSQTIANPDEKRRHRDLPPDLRPFVSANINVLDELLFRRVYPPAAVAPDVLEQNQRSLEDQLLAAKFIHPGETRHPTILGILSIGKSPLDWIPGAYVQFLRIDGTRMGDPIKDAKEISGPLPNLMSELEDVIRTNIATAHEFIVAAREVTSPDYPVAALQQIVRNAILHRSYENTNAPVRMYWFADRVEIQNPGGPFGQVTKSNFGQPGAYDYRNPNLAAAMRDLGYVQRFGSGIEITRRTMAENGNPPPEFQVEDSHIAVILRSRS
ncbi:hypothetical protein JW905_09285 [bacterium]|nr:hypothetical protein [candidate division CSSED10-310 bacterium]